MYQEGGEQYGAQLAPFIPQEDLFQLSDSLPTDLQNLFPEIEFSEFFAADVPPSKTQVGERHCAYTNRRIVDDESTGADAK